MRCIRIVLHDGDSICGATFSDRVLTMWLDGLTDLIGSGSLSRDAMTTADRLLNIELRLRLLDVPNPQSSVEVNRRADWLFKEGTHHEESSLVDVEQRIS
ncbi:hypothetical protein COOONC_16556 [Cooperia oncophora]